MFSYFPETAQCEPHTLHANVVVLEIQSLYSFIRMKPGQARIKLGLYEIKDLRDKMGKKTMTNNITRN